jgi:2-methylcitrate dehydratase PrpD
MRTVPWNAAIFSARSCWCLRKTRAVHNNRVDPAVGLSAFTTDLAFAHISPDVAKTIKLFILDTLGVAVAGTTAPGCRELVEQVREWDRSGAASLLNFGDRVSLPSAALVNATLAEARDFDDTYDRGIVHVMAATVSAGLAVAEQRGGVSGADLITAVAAGAEIMCRIGAACKSPLTWTRTSTIGGFAAAATSSKLYGYSRETTQHALGIAYVQAAGNSQTIEDGALVKRMQVGFAARAGLVAAQLAGKGITGPSRIFEGKHGYFELYERGDYVREVLEIGLGQTFEVEQLSVKPYPCARDSHAAMDAARALRNLGIRPEDIDQVTISVSKAIFNVGGKPWEKATGNPVVEAILSLPYAVAVMLLRGDVFIGDFSEQSVCDPLVNQLARSIRVVENRDVDPNALVPVIVEAKLKSGAVHSATCNVMRGSPSSMLSEREFVDKFNRCMEYAANPVSANNATSAIESILSLEHVKDVAVLMPMLRGPEG